MVRIRYYLVPEWNYLVRKILERKRISSFKPSRIVRNLFKIGSLLRNRYLLVPKAYKPYI